MIFMCVFILKNKYVINNYIKFNYMYHTHITSIYFKISPRRNTLKNKRKKDINRLICVCVFF